MALVGTSGVAAARSNHADHKDRKVHKDRDGKHETRKQSRHRKKHKKKAIVCIKAPCPGDGARHDDETILLDGVFGPICLCSSIC